MKYFIGCDLGGTNLRMAIVDVTSGSILCRKSVSTNANADHNVVINLILDLIKQIITETGFVYSDLAGIGIGIPGIVDTKHNETIFLPNFRDSWRNLPVGKILYDKTGLETKLLNDVQAITFGECLFGAGRRKNSIALLAIGTGIGGGLFLNGELYSGTGGMAGAFGHMIIDSNGPSCVCGSNGCLEVFASGSSISAMGRNAVMQGRQTIIKDLCQNNENLITPEIIANAAVAGDEVAIEIYEKAGDSLGIAICNIVTIISPQRIIIAGGVGKAGNLLLFPVQKNIQSRIHPIIADKVDVIIAELGDDAGIIGSACWSAGCI